MENIFYLPSNAKVYYKMYLKWQENVLPVLKLIWDNAFFKYILDDIH